MSFEPHLKRTIVLLLGVALLPATVLASQPKTIRNQPRRNQMLVQAVAAADRIARRFHTTLDFAPVFNDQFVTEPGLRSRAIAGDVPDQPKGFDQATRERFYVVVMTLLHLWAGYRVIQNVSEVPPEIDKLEPKPEWLFSSDSKQPANLQEANQAILEAEKVSAIYRKYFSADSFRGPIYLENIRSERERARTYRHNVPRVEKGNRKFHIPESVPVYVVRPEFFDYYFVQEKGAMKLFYVNILPNFKLF